MAPTILYLEEEREEEFMHVKEIGRMLYRDRYLLFMMLPAIIITLFFSYIPMSGIIMAFQDYSSGKGIFESPFVGFKHFQKFFTSIYAARVIGNTIKLSFFNLLCGFAVPIIFALFLNEIRSSVFKKLIQTVSYLPHFVSTVVVVGMLVSFFDPTFGLVNVFRTRFGLDSISFLSSPKWFRTMYIGSDVWQHFGWNSIIYISAIAGIPQEMYEAVEIDGAGRFMQALYITLPSLLPTILTLFILNCGWMFSIGFEKVILMYKPSSYEVADIISTYVYRTGILNNQTSFATAIGLFNSLLNMIILIAVNHITKRLSSISVF
jgi:putative aldouronate transport system permease protein